MSDLRGVLVREVCTATPVILDDTMTLGDAYEALVGESISGAPIVDASGDLLGVVSASDLLLALAPFLDPQEDTPQIEDLQALKATKISDYISAEPLTCLETTPLADACSLMERKGVHRLVVVDGQKVRGIISSLDVIRAVASAGE